MGPQDFAYFRVMKPVIFRCWEFEVRVRLVDRAVLFVLISSFLFNSPIGGVRVGLRSTNNSVITTKANLLISITTQNRRLRLGITSSNGWRTPIAAGPHRAIGDRLQLAHWMAGGGVMFDASLHADVIKWCHLGGSAIPPAFLWWRTSKIRPP